MSAFFKPSARFRRMNPIFCGWLARGVGAGSLGPGHTGELINLTGPSPQRTGSQTRSCNAATPVP
jgi:hypothetical protein